MALAVEVDQRRRWDRFRVPVALALILGVRAMRARNCIRHERHVSTPKLDPEPPPRALVARTVDGRTTIWCSRRWAWQAPGSGATCRRGSPSPSGRAV